MTAPKGNQFWRARSTHGRRPKFNDPEKLWSACCEYFQWVDTNPLKLPKPYTIKARRRVQKIDQVRAMSLHGLCIFLDIARATWDRYRKRKNLVEVVNRVEAIIRTQKFEAAAAFMLHPVIISRDLKLGEREVSDTDEAEKAQVKVDAADVKRKLLPETSGSNEEGSV